VEDIRKVVNATGAAGTSGGTLEQHGLNSWYHTGELAQSQASWAATKVELSNHAALPDVHHAKLHAITDAANHSVTGSQYQIVGLTAVNTLGLLTPKSSPVANEIVKTDGSSAVTLVDLTVTSDLFLTGYLDFGTDVMYEDASYLQVTGSKAVRFGQNIGNANWTVYNAGGASFGGNVDIVGGGDLTVGSNVLFVDNSLAGVGINMAPDPQFALDINGPARATYWIGPHAIQVKDAIMICHYDGRQPFNTNFNGEPNGHFGQVGTIAGGIIFVQGKFGKALQVADACTNYFTDPSCEYDASLTQWSKYNATGTLTATRNQDVTPLYGTYVGRLVQSSTGTGLFFQTVTVPAGTAALSCYVRKLDKSAVADADCNLYYDGNKTTTYTAVGDGWYRLTWTGGTSGASFQVGITVKTGKTVYVDGFQVEATNITPYCDGSLGSGHTWSGTANASTSARTWASLQYTLPTIAADAPLTLMAWVNIDTATSKNYHYPWFTVNDGYSVYINSSRTLYVGTVNCGTLPAGWVHIALTTDGTGTVTAYVNGVSKGTASITRSGLTAFNVGSHSGGLCANGLIDDFAIIGRALPAAEIRSIYESNAPIFAETSTFSFRPTPKGLIWADDEGLWMRDTAGKPVLGVYGGEAATKNWGGFNLVPGDLLFGNNAVGSSAIWWSRVNGTFGFYGAGSGTPQVEIATDGRLTAGAGKVKLDSTGFHALNASNVATIDINEQGIYLGDGGARTTIATWTSGNRIRAYNVGEVYEATPETYLDDSSVSRTLYPLVMRAIRQGNDAALVEISAVNTSNVGAFLRVGEGFRLKDYFGSPYNTNRMVHLSATDIILEATNLQLRSLTTSGTAVGSYSGKIRINISGTNYYIPYYAS